MRCVEATSCYQANFLRSFSVPRMKSFFSFMMLRKKSDFTVVHSGILPKVDETGLKKAPGGHSMTIELLRARPSISPNGKIYLPWNHAFTN